MIIFLVLFIVYLNEYLVLFIITLNKYLVFYLYYDLNKIINKMQIYKNMIQIYFNFTIYFFIIIYFILLVD